MKKSLASVEVMSEIRGRLRSVRVDDRARWGKLTAKRMVRHLICSYEMALGERTVEPQEWPLPVLVKWIALRSGLRWQKNIQTVPELKKAIQDRRPTVGMDREEVIAAIGKPEHKVRERDSEGNEIEDWIYGQPPSKTVFVRFQGEHVTSVRQFPQ